MKYEFQPYKKVFIQPERTETTEDLALKITYALLIVRKWPPERLWKRKKLLSAEYRGALVSSLWHGSRISLPEANILLKMQNDGSIVFYCKHWLRCWPNCDLSLEEAAKSLKSILDDLDGIIQKEGIEIPKAPAREWATPTEVQQIIARSLKENQIPSK
jgi:hypothetical protein